MKKIRLFGRIRATCIGVFIIGLMIWLAFLIFDNADFGTYDIALIVVLSALIIFLSFIEVVLSREYLIMDNEKIVFKHAWGKSQSINWDEIDEVEVYKTFPCRYIFISNFSEAGYRKAQMKPNLVGSQKIFSVNYSKRNLRWIQEFYKGEVKGLH